MNLDLYISKYIDGDLNEKEELLLRRMLDENPDARSVFDSALDIHLAMKADADSIEAPEDLLSDTEDIVMMRILATAPDASSRLRGMTQVYSMVASIAVLFFVFVFQIDDFMLPKHNTSLAEANTTILTEQSNTVTKPIQKLTPNKPKLRIASNNSLAEAQTNIIDDSKESEASVVVIQEEVVNSVVQLKNPENETNQTMLPLSIVLDSRMNSDMLKERFSTQNTKTLSSESFAINAQEKLSDNSKSAKLANNEEKNQVQPTPLVKNNEETIQISSFLGTDVVRQGIETNNATAISHYSQSIAYSVDSEQRLGIEFGVTEYGFTETVTHSRSYFSSVVKSQGLKSKNDVLVAPSNYFIQYKVVESKNAQFLWTSAFYEHQLFKYSTITVDGRMGLGFTSEGVLGYGRVFGRYELIKGIFVTLGAEARAFNAEFPKLEERERKFKSSATVVYGLQFKF